MQLKKCVLSMALVLAASAGHADLRNISATATHSASTLQGVACTIVGTTGPFYRGTKILYVFAESTGNGRDPKLRVSSLKYNLVVTNEDWQKPWFINGAAHVHDSAILYSGFLRTPQKTTDAAIIYFADPGEAVCAFTNEAANDDGRYQVQISITDMTDAITGAGIKSAQLSAMPVSADTLWAEFDTLKKQQPGAGK